VIEVKVNGINGRFITKLYGQKQLQKKDKAEQSAGSERDTVNISAEVREIRRLVEKTLNISDIRPEKVEDLKRKIEAGEYNIPAEELADKILEYMKKI